MSKVSRRKFLAGAAATAGAAVTGVFGLGGGQSSAASTAQVKKPSVTGLYLVNYFPAQRGGPDQWSNYNGTTVRNDMALAKSLGFNGFRVQLAANASGLGWPTPTSAYLANLQDFYQAAQANGMFLHLACYDQFGGLWTQITNSETWLTSIISNFQAVDSTLAQIAILETHNEAFSAADQSSWSEILPWVQAITLKMYALAPGIPVTTSVPSGQGTASGGLGTYYNASFGTNWQPTWYDYHLYGGQSSILSQLQTAQAVVGSAGLHIGEFGWDVEGTTESQSDLTNQAEYAQNGRHYCQVAGIPEPAWWQLYDVAPDSSEFSSGQCDGLYTVSGAIKAPGQVYEQYPPGVTVPLYGTTGNTVTVTNPGNQTSTVGVPVSLQMAATDSQSGQTFTWTATGLPNGLGISSSGLISGTPTTPVTNESVTVTATDTTGAHGSAVFDWTVNAAVTGPGTPYVVADYTSVMAGGPTFTVPVNASGLGTGDSLLVIIGTSGTLTLSNVTDTKDNPYTIDNASHADRSVAFAYSVDPSVLGLGTDHLTVTLSSSAGDVRVVVLGLPGVSAVDKTPAGNGSSNGSSPSAATGTLSTEPEVCVGAVCNSGSAQPTSPWTIIRYEGTTPVLTVAYKLPGNTTASQTFSGTISGGAAYDVGVITFS